MKFFFYSLILFCLAALTGFFGYSAYISNYAYTQTSRQLSMLQQNINAAPLLKYGVIQSVDPAARTITVRFNSGLVVQIMVPANAFIARQDLIETNGVYTGALPPLPGIFENLQPEQKVGLLLSKDESGSFSTVYVLVGNPL